MRRLLLAVAFCLFASSLWAEPLKQIKVVNDRAPDCSSLKSIVESVTRDCKTDDERAIAIYNFCRYAYYHFAYPREKDGVGALKMINVYGWSLCGGQHSVLSALWEAAGFDTRFIGWRGHTTVECRYDGQWHYFDTFLKCYFWKDAPGSPGGRTVASQADIAANPGIVNDGIVFDEFGNPVEYHILKSHPGSGMAAAAMDYDRIPADSVIHWFRTDRPGQQRGLPDILPALPLFAQLRRYTLAVIAAAESAANIAVLMTPW